MILLKILNVLRYIENSINFKLIEGRTGHSTPTKEPLSVFILPICCQTPSILLLKVEELKLTFINGSSETLKLETLNSPSIDALPKIFKLFTFKEPFIFELP